MGTDSSKNFHGEVIHCGEYVGHSDVANFIRKRKFQDGDRKLLQECYRLFESKPDFVWQNCAIEVMCSSFSVKFASGDQTNRYIIRLEDGRHHTAPMSKEFRTRFYNTYDWLRDHARGIVDSIAGAIKDSPKEVLSLGWKVFGK